MNYAETFLQELQERRALYGNDDPAVAETLNALGLVYLHMYNEIDQAISCHKEALAIFKSTQKQHALKNLAMTLADVGRCYWRKGESNQAHSCLRESFEVCKLIQINDDDPIMYSVSNQLRMLSCS